MTETMEKDSVSTETVQSETYSKPLRTQQEIDQEYTQSCLKIGDAHYKIMRLHQEIKKLHTLITDLKNEMVLLESEPRVTKGKA